MYGSIPGNGLAMPDPPVVAVHALRPPPYTSHPRRQRHAELPADGADRPALQVFVAGDGRLRERPIVNPDVMPTAVVVEAAVVEAKVLLEQTPAHVRARLFVPASTVCRNSFARDCFSDLRASRAISNASSTVSASVMSCGSNGDVTMYPPSSAASSVSTSFPSLTVYCFGMARNLNL